MNSDKPQDLNQIENKTLFFASRHAAFFRSLGRFVRKGARIGRIKVGPKSVLAVLLVVSIAYILAPFQSKAGYSFQANYDDGSLDAYNALGSRTAGTDTSLPSLNASGYNSTNSLSYSYDGTSTLKYATASNLPTDKGSVEMKFQKSAYGNNADQDKGSMYRPSGIAYDPATQYIYTADRQNHRIIKTKIDGTDWTTFGHYGTGTGEFSYPSDVAIDSSTGFIFVKDSCNGRVVKTKFDGTGWQTLTGFSTTECNTRNLGWYHENEHRIYYDSASEYIYSVSAAGSIVKSKIDGTGRTTLSSFGGHKMPADISGLTYDSASGYLFATTTNGHLVRTKEDGTDWSDVTGLNTTATGSIFYDPVSTYLYIANSNSGQIVKCYYDGSSWQTLGGFSFPTSVFVDTASGMMYVSNSSGHNIIKTADFSTTGWTAYGSYYNNLMKFGGGAGSGYDDNPGVSYDPSTGYLYIADNPRCRIIKTKMDGTGWQAYGTCGSGVGQFKYPSGVFYDSSSGYIYVGDRGNSRLVKTKIDGTGWTALNVSEGFMGIFYDSATDYIYYTDYNYLKKTKIDGTGSGSLAGFNQPINIFYDIASDPSHDGSGDFYIANKGANNIIKTKFNGTGWTAYGTNGSGTGQFSSPKGVSYDSSTGFLYVSDAGNYRMVKTKLDGSWTGWTAYGASGGGTGQFNSNKCLSYDSSSSNLYIYDQNNYRIVKISDSLDGTGWQTTSDYTAKEKILFSAQATDDSRLVYDVASRKLRFYLAYSNKAQFVETPTLNLTDGQWYTVKASFNKAAHTLSIDLDGTNQATATYDSDWGSLSFGTYFYIGARNASTTDRWDGMIDDINVDIQAVDTTDPANPTAAHVYSSSDLQTEYNSGGWGSDNDPYITFSGAADDDSGLKGYYIYFGTSNAADPVTTSGVLESGGAFHYQDHSGADDAVQTVQVPTDALADGSTYYLLIKTQDTDLNVSDNAAGLFTFKSDVTNPSANPSTFAGYDTSAKANELETGHWYNYAHPYFEWSGATDAGSGIYGYYVYFGTNVDANPVVSGSLVTSASYTYSGTVANGSTYYLRVKAADFALNTFAEATTAFTYKYTNDAPGGPTISGWDTSAKENAILSDAWYGYNAPHFEWLGSTSTSGIAGYYVYFGSNGSANPEVDGSWQTSTSYDVSSQMSAGSTYYLLVQSKDNANNISSAIQFVYKFDNQSPSSNPTSFKGYSDSQKTATLTSDNWYNIAQPYFEWDGAVDSHSGIKGYWVYFGTDADAVPSTAGTFQTAVSKTISQTLTSGTTYYFILQSENNAGNKIARTSYFTYKFDSAAPTMAELINVSPVGCSIQPTFSMSWDAAVDPAPGSGFKTYQYKIGSTGTTHDLSAVSIDVPSYQDGDNVFYLRGVDNAGNISNWQTGVYCSTGVAHIIDGPNVKAGPASLTVSWTSSKPTKGSVVVYEGNEYLTEQTGGEFDINHNVKVVGLEPEKSYRYQLKWYDASGNSGVSDWFTTTTTTAPSIENFNVAVLSTDRAIFSWSTSENATSTLTYGKDILDTTIVIAGTATSFSREITGLTGGTTYQVRINARTVDEFPFYYVASFSTPPLPIITGLKFEPVSGQAETTVSVTWATNVETTSALFYGPKGENKKEISSIEKTKDHSMEIKGLLDSTSYEIYAVGTDQYGNIAQSETNTFMTPNDTRPPKISAISTETSNVGLDKQDQAQIVVSWRTDELSTSYVEYDEGLSGAEYKNKTSENKALTNSHLVVVTALKPGQPYHLRVSSADKAGNLVSSEDITIVTGDVPKSVFSILIGTLENIFGWLSSAL